MTDPTAGDGTTAEKEPPALADDPMRHSTGGDTPPEGLVLEEPPARGSKHPLVLRYRDYLQAHPKVSARVLETNDEKEAAGAAAAFQRLEHFHATYRKIDSTTKVWVVYDPDKPKQSRSAGTGASRGSGSSGSRRARSS